MAQAITSWFICDGRFRVHAINAVGRRRAKIIEIEEVDKASAFMALRESLSACSVARSAALANW